MSDNFPYGYVDPDENEQKKTFNFAIPSKPKLAIHEEDLGYVDDNSSQESPSKPVQSIFPKNMDITGYTDNQSQDSQEDSVPSLKKTVWSSTAGSSQIYQSIASNRKRTNVRDWNEEFQSLIEQTYEDGERELERTKQLRQLCEQFATVASQVGKIIISELYIPTSQKKIPPITDRVGGVAGGIKYFYEGIFFKLPVDDYDIYDDEEGIMKCAGHELRGLKHLIDCRIKGLHYPLMILCDYRGHRLLAESLLPLGLDSLVYGSSDGGRTIVATNNEMNEKCKLVAEMLNLKEEFVWNNSKSFKTLLHLSCDIEGHIGKDGRAYLVDFARLWPPTTPRPGVKGDFLVRQMRPEFVKSTTEPLCSDSFSGFGLENKPIHNDEVRAATTLLETKLLPEFALKLESLYNPLNHSTAFNKSSTTTIENIIVEMHRQGINIRYLGMLRSYVQNKELKSLLLTEIVARVAKNSIRKKMRNLKSSKEDHYIAKLVDSLNKIFGVSESYSEFWETIMLPQLQNRFKSSLSEAELEGFSVMKLEIQWCILFLRFQTLLGIKYSKTIYDFVLEDYESAETSNRKVLEFPSQFTFTNESIAELTPIVKHIHRIFFEEGTALSRMAISQSSDALFAQAEEKFKMSLQFKPNDYRSLSNWGLSIMKQAENKMKDGNFDEVNKLFESAHEKFKSATTIEQRDYKTWNKWGNCYATQASYNKIHPSVAIELLTHANEKYSMAHSLNTNDDEVLFNWGNSLLAQAKLSVHSTGYIDLLRRSCEKYEKAQLIKRDSYHVLRNFAATLSKLAREVKDHNESKSLYLSCFSKYKDASAIKPNDHENYFNWANALYHQATMSYIDPSESKQFILDAGEKYFHAIKLKMDFIEAYNNWIKSLLHLAGIVKYESINGSPADTHLQSQIEILFFKTLLGLQDFDLLRFPSDVNLLVEFAVRNYKDTTRVMPLLVIAFKELSSYVNMNNNDINGNQPERLQKKRKPDFFTKSYSEEMLWTSPSDFSSPRSQEHLYISKLADKLSSMSAAEQRASQDQLTEENFEFLEIIGGTQGSFVTTYKARKKRSTDDQLFAIKVIKKDLIVTDQKPLSHPFIVEQKYFFVDEKRAYFVYDFVPGTQIMMLAKDRKRISEDRARFYTAELILALNYMHSQGSFMRDLSPSKILLDRTGHVSLIQNLTLLDNNLGQSLDLSCEYMAPEILEGRDDGPSVDWWSLGVILYLFLTGSTPFASSQVNEIIEKIMMETVTIPNDISTDASSLLLMLLNRDEVARMKDAKNIKNHSFFSEIDWSLLESKKLEPPYKPIDDTIYKIVFPDSEMSDTFVMPNIHANFGGFTFAIPRKTQQQ